MTRRWLSAICLVLVAGCAYRSGYTMRGDVKTIAVPVFANDTFYRAIEIDLTRAVVTRIEKETPYRMTDSTSADAVLTGRIKNYRLAVLQEDADDMPTEMQIILSVEVTLTDTRTGEILFKGIVRDGDDFSSTAGETELTTRARLFNRMAQEIVEKTFESKW